MNDQRVAFHPLTSPTAKLFLSTIAVYTVIAITLNLLPELFGYFSLAVFAIAFWCAGLLTTISTVGTFVVSVRHRAALWLLVGQLPACVYFLCPAIVS